MKTPAVLWVCHGVDVSSFFSSAAAHLSRALLPAQRVCCAKPQRVQLVLRMATPPAAMSIPYPLETVSSLEVSEQEDHSLVLQARRKNPRDGAPGRGFTSEGLPLDVGGAPIGVG